MEKFIKAVEKHGQLAKDALDFLWKNPETGYKEWKAHAYLTEKLRALGYELTEAGNIPGFYTDVDTGRPGYSPRMHDKGMMEVAAEALTAAVGQCELNSEGWGTGCSDLGDVSMVFPAVHPNVGGVTGTGHGNDYFISDPDLAAVGIAKGMMLMTHLLLKDNAQRGWEIKKNFVPTFATMEEYFACIDALDMDKDAVVYNEDGTVTLDYTK